MKILTDIVARLLFAIPMFMIGLAHFTNTDAMAERAPFGGAIIIYLTGVALLAAAVSIVIKKKAALATLLLGIYLVLTALTVNLVMLMNGDEMAMSQVLKDLALAGGAWFMSGVFRKEEETGSGSVESSE